MKTSLSKRLLALLLVLCMVLPMAPAITLPTKAATTDPVIVIAASDYQNESGSETDTALVDGLFDSIKTNGGYTTADGFLFAGDYSYQFTEAEARAGMATVRSAAKTAWSTITDDDIVLVQGNHDPDSATTDGTLSPSGANDADAYGVYVIHEKDYMWYNNDEATVKSTAASLRDYLNQKITQGYDKPIFVVSHLPLHYNMRTYNEGDGQYANYIFDVLNSAGACGLNIIFLFGHDHSNGWDDYLGGSAIYLKKGDSINIAQSSKTVFQAETLNFTYMNTGYVAYYKGVNDGAETDLTMTVFEITGSDVTISRYSAAGLHDLKSAGVANAYKNETAYEPNTTVYTSPQTVELSQLATSASGITVTSDGVTGVTATVISGNTPLGYSAYRTYDIDPTGYTKGNSATVTIPVDATFDSTRPALVIDHDTTRVYTCPIVDGKVTFETNHFSDYTVAQADVEPVTATGTTKFLKRVTSVDDLAEGVPYVISDYNDDWYHYLLTNTVGSYVSSSSGTFAGLILDGVPSVDTEHLWYIKDGKLVYGSADSEDYLLITSSGVSIGAYDESAAAYAQANAYTGTYGVDDLGIVSASGALNRRGGKDTSIVATYYSTPSGSYWHFDAVVEADISLSVVPSLSTMTTSQTAVMAPTVTVDGVEANDYTLTWSSADTSVATVDADGFVQPLNPGRTEIVATLTDVNGITLSTPISVEIPINVYAVDKSGTVARASATMQTMEQVSDLVSGVASGPYVISSALTTSYKYLSGNVATSSRNVEGLELVTTNDYSHVWYYDGTYLRYNDPNGPYLAYEDGIIKLSTSSTNAFNSVEANGTSYLIKNTNLSGSQCLNQSGGGSYNTVALYSDGNWKFNKVDASLVELVVNPGNDTLKIGEAADLLATVLQGGVLQSDYTLSWSVANSSVATVSDGTVTGVAAGTTTVTCTLTSLNGAVNQVPLYVNIPIEVTAEEKTENSITAQGYTDKAMTQVTSLTSGVASGPYVISNPNVSPNSYLTGNGPVTSTLCTGLEIVTTNDYKHVWYYDGTYLRYNAPNGPYLAYENGQVVLSDDSSAAFNDIHRLANSDGSLSSGYIIQNDNVSGYNCLNQLGGGNYNAAGMYYEYSGSRWYFNEVTLNQPVTLTVTPDTAAVYAGETVSLVPTVTVDGVHTSSYTVSWASSDTSVATVANGVVTALEEGRATITATLTQADGLGADIAVEIPISVLTLSEDSQHRVTVSTVLGPRRVQVTSLPEGVSGPYLIDNRASGYILTGTEGVRSPATVGLWLKPPVADDYTDLWYYDGTNLIYGDPNATDRYLVYENNMVALGSDTSEAFDIVTPNTSGNQGSFNLTASVLADADYKNLNQYGSGTYEAAGLYTMDGNSNTGSAWDFFSLSSESEIDLTVYPTDYSTDLLITETKKLSSYLFVDSVKTSNYTLTYSVSDPSIALVGKDGTIYPQSSGTVTVYARLNTLDGEAVSTDIIVPITIRVCGVQSVAINTKEGSLPLNASERLKVSAVSEDAEAPVLTVTYENGVQKTVPLTSAYLTDADGNEVSAVTAGTFENLTVAYEGVVACTDFTLHVVKSELPDYPDYPDEGSVFVDKTASDTQNFQSSGIAQVELSTSGVPAKKGADVIIMLDTSSSMKTKVEGTSDERLNVLCASLNNLINGFQEKASDGTNMDIRVAVADFNGYYFDEYSNYYIDSADTVDGSTIRTTAGNGEVYTGDKSFTTGAFIKAQDFGLNPFTTNRGYAGETTGKYTLTWASGTNYDFAFDAVYQLGEAINDANAEAGEDRDLFVIFMSDGAPFQYNYFSAQSGSTYWNNYLMGTMQDSMFASGSHKDYYHEDGKHWMAEAIKGERNLEYSVIRKNDYRDTDGDNFIQVNGLGATMYAIGFCLQVDGKITEESMNYVIEQVATGEDYSFFAKTADELDSAFTQISNDIMYAASDAYFIDTMGAEYDLKLGNHDYVLNGTATTFTENQIQVRSYEIYTQADFEAGNCTENQIGVRKTDASGNPIYTVLETVTFNETGTEAYSDLIYTAADDGTKTYTNILNDGIIAASTFWYNTNSTAKTITVTGTTTTYSLPAETFYWKVGTISTRELALNYFVYLTGAVEGTRNANIYPTNTSAILYYENYLGNDCHLVAPIPTMPWGKAQVGYGFYLVDESGKPIVNKTTGLTGSFQMAVKLGDIQYQEFLTNSSVTLTATDCLSSSTVPEGYALYDNDAKYQVALNSDGAGSIRVYAGEDVLTTYITGLSSSAVPYGDAEGTQKPTTNFATANTVVWFALVSTVEAVDDIVVIDYGLSVDIHPFTNNSLMTTGYASVVGMAKNDPGVDFSATALSGFTGLNGQLTLDHGTVKFTNDGSADVAEAAFRYTPSNMQMRTEDIFAYGIYYTGDIGTHGYYYGTVTVIPATEIYYEDNFVSFKSYTTVKSGQYGAGTAVEDTTSKWTDAGTRKNPLQTESRPGDNPTGNSYGFDDVYFASANCSTYSMGSAKKLEVGYVDNGDGTYSYTSGTAEFTFWGTAFDVISMTNATTGTIMVRVYDADSTSDTALANYMVDTYYGYKFDTATNKWVEDTEEKDTLYQVPVIKVDMNKVIKTYDDPETTDVDETEYYDYGYGHYKVVITVSYNYLFDHGQIAYKNTDGDNTEKFVEAYDFYLDAIRIYDPANNGENSQAVLDAYEADNEAWPIRYEVRDLLLGAAEYAALGTASQRGAIFIDGNSALDDSTASGVPGTENSSTSKSYIADYANFGPNNELYLAPGQSVAFNLADDSNVAKIRMGIRSVAGVGAMKILRNGQAESAVSARSIPSANDCNWIITGRKGTTVIVYNAGSTVLSLTNITATHYAAPTSGSSLIYVNRQTGELALAALGVVAEETVQPTLKLSYPTVSFEDEILYNVYFSAENTDDVEQLGLLTFDSEVTDGTVDNCVGNYTAALGADGLYMATTDGVAAKKLGDTVYFKAYAKLTDGTYVYSDLRSYSAKQYAMSQLSGSNEAVKPLVVAMLNYGAAAQQAFGYRTDALVNADLTAEQQALVIGYRADLFSGIPTVDASKTGSFTDNGGFSQKYPTVSFEGAFAINYYFTPANSVDGDVTLYCWTQETYDSVTELTADNATALVMTADDAGVYSTCYDGIAAKELGDNVYVAAVYESEGVRYCSGVLGYSVGAYCKGFADDASSSMNAIAQATAVYAYYAESYFSAQ